MWGNLGKTKGLTFAAFVIIALVITQAILNL